MEVPSYHKSTSVELIVGAFSSIPAFVNSVDPEENPVDPEEPLKIFKSHGTAD